MLLNAVNKYLIVKLTCLLSVFALCGGGTAFAQRGTTNRPDPVNSIPVRVNTEPDEASCDTIPSYWSKKYVTPFSAFPDSLLWIEKGTCKTYQVVYYQGLDRTRGLRDIGRGNQTAAAGKSRKSAPLLQVHGSIQYDFLYRSYVDTPFTQHHYQQHTLQTSLSILLRDHYPLQVYGTRRLSNSPYFRDRFDIQVQFDRHAYIRQAKQRAVEQLERHQLHQPDIQVAEQLLAQAMKQYRTLREWINSGDVLQRLIEEREQSYFRQLSRTPQGRHPLQEVDLDRPGPHLRYKGTPNAEDLFESTKADGRFRQYFDQKNKELDSLGRVISSLRSRTDSLKNAVARQVATLKEKVNKASRIGELKRLQTQSGESGDSTGRLDRFLDHVKSIGIGRSLINYSELTAWNVALTGLNIEYNSGLYAALAVGKLDFGYRDFWGGNARTGDQHLLLGRLGWGDVDQKAIIFTAFTGRKYHYGTVGADSLSPRMPVAGYSVEGILKKNKWSSLSAEVAKTTTPFSGSFRQNRALKSLVNFDDHRNLGVSLKGQTRLPRWGTALSGFFRKSGENFQSFSLFSYNTDQTAWALKMDQPLLKERINVVAALRRNDFTNPFSDKNFKTSTIFKSIQLQARLPRWPSLSVGYYPGTQLYLVDRERLRESVYYILNGSLVYTYAAGRTRMLSSLIYNRYSNKATDSGFIAYKGVSYMAAQHFLFGKTQLQGVYTFTDQEQMQYYTLEGGGDYSFARAFRLGAAAKYNRVRGQRSYLGSRAHLAFDLKKLGGFQLLYEKSYLPTTQQTLFAVEVGRVSWYKNF